MLVDDLFGNSKPKTITLPIRAALKSDEFRTIAGSSSANIRVEGSRFHALAAPIESKQQADDYIAKVRKESFDATHHCYAYRLGTDGDQFRFSDDGEPSGTAGKPILSSIDKLGLTNVLVVVTRYFGGTKLGTGGLARAYGEAADQALARARSIQQYVTETMTLIFPHSQTGNVMRLVSRPGIEIDDTGYDEEVHLRIRVRKSLSDDIGRELLEVTSGNVRLKRQKEVDRG
jgi:uncharacterized YigZ family protein